MFTLQTWYLLFSQLTNVARKARKYYFLYPNLNSAMRLNKIKYYIRGDSMARKDMMEGCGPKCIMLGLLAAAFAAAGFWMVIGGIMKQWSGMAPMSNVFLWYFGGLILVMISKGCKFKSCSMCKSM